MSKIHRSVSIVAWSSLVFMNATAQTALADELKRMRTLDQQDRRMIGAYAVGTVQRDSVNRHLMHQDSLNLRRVAEIIDSVGWPDAKVIGAEGGHIIWLVLQHADLVTQEKYLPVMQAAVAQGKARPQDLAYLEDRIEWLNGRPQIYGSQIVLMDGEYRLWPLRDGTRVDEWRARMGLGPLEKHLASMGILPSPRK